MFQLFFLGGGDLEKDEQFLGMGKLEKGAGMVVRQKLLAVAPKRK